MLTPGSIVTTAREANGDLNNDKDKKCYEPGNDFTRATRVGGVRYFSNAPACLFNNLYNRYANCL